MSSDSNIINPQISKLSSHSTYQPSDWPKTVVYSYVL